MKVEVNLFVIVTIKVIMTLSVSWIKTWVIRTIENSTFRYITIVNEGTWVLRELNSSFYS